MPIKQLRPKDSYLYSGLQDFIREYCNKDTVMAEIGCWIGESTLLFANAVKKVYAIDAWDIQMSNEPVLSDNSFALAEEIFDKNVSIFKNIIKIKNTSFIASQILKDKSFDLVYIDANHDYYSVLGDIRVWLPKVKDGGIIAGHDYIANSDNYGVMEAVNEVFCKPDKVFEDTTWVKVLV